MAIVKSYRKSYRTCDICGKKLPHDVGEWNYHVESPSKIKVGIWKYIFSDPYDGFWSNSIDMCEECWEEMRNEIRKRVENNGT